jgi:hypothetical protein
MAVDMKALNAAVAAAAAQADKTKTTEEGAGVLIASIGAQITTAVTAALQADDVADQGSIDASTAAITAVIGQFAESDDKLGKAIANVPAAA